MDLAKRKFFATVAAIVILLTTITFVSAASVSWSDGQGLHTISVNVTGNYGTVVRACVNGSTVSHTQGVAGDGIYVNAGDYSTCYASCSSSSYYSYLEQAMRQSGINMYMSASYSSGGWYSIPQNTATGVYAMGHAYQCKTGTWTYTLNETTLNREAAPLSTVTGVITYAPYSMEGATLCKVG